MTRVCSMIRGMVRPPRGGVIADQRQLRHPIGRAEPAFAQVAHALDDNDRFPRHLHRERDQRTDDQDTDENGERNRGGRGAHALGRQPFAQRPGGDGEHRRPGQRRQEAPQQPDRQRDQHRDQNDAAEQLQRRLIHDRDHRPRSLQIRHAL
jgi:hypothetical protein